MGRTDNAKRNLIWGFIQKIVSVLIPFVSRTIMIYVLGMEYIGLNSLFASILSMLSFAELGIGSALVFSMYKPIADGDDDKVCALLAFYRRCYIVIGTIIVGCGLVILPFLDKFITVMFQVTPTYMCCFLFICLIMQLDISCLHINSQF